MVFLLLFIISVSGCKNSGNTRKSVIPTNTDNNYSNRINYAIEPQLTEIGPKFVDGIMLIGTGDDENKKYGFIDNMGNIIAEPIYDYTYYTSYASCGDNSGFSEGLACVCKDGKWGYIDKKGNEIIEFKYPYADNFYEGLAAVSLKEGGKVGYINKSGELVIKESFDIAYQFYNGVAIVKINDKYYFIDTLGNIVRELDYDSIDLGRYDYEWKYSGIIRVEKNGLVGAIYVKNGEIKVIVEPKYSYLSAFGTADGQANFSTSTKNETCGVIDISGKEIIRFEGKALHVLSEGRYAASNYNGKWGYLDQSGNVIIPFKYDEVEGFNNGLAVVKLNQKSGLIDRDGKEVLQFDFDSIKVTDNNIVVEENGKWYLLDCQTLKKISNEYDFIGLGDQIFPVQKNNKVGIISKTGREIISPRYDNYENSFFEVAKDYMWVKQGEEWFCLDIQGKNKFATSFEAVSLFEHGIASVQKDGKCGVIDFNGEVVVPFIFDSARIIEKGLIEVISGGKYGKHGIIKI